MKDVNDTNLSQQTKLQPITGGKLILYLYDGVVRFCQEAIAGMREGDIGGSAVVVELFLVLFLLLPYRSSLYRDNEKVFSPPLRL